MHVIISGANKRRLARRMTLAESGQWMFRFRNEGHNHGRTGMITVENSAFTRSTPYHEGQRRRLMSDLQGERKPFIR